MKVLLTGSTGGIGSAIKEALKEHEIDEMSHAEYDFASDTYAEKLSLHKNYHWLIFAHGTINEKSLGTTFLVNTMSCMYLTEFFKPTTGAIFISSTAAINGNDQFPFYAASKAAINNYAKSLARKYKECFFYALCPGPTDTKMWHSLGLEGEAQDPSEVAKAVQQIMDGKFKSGDIITVRDGKITV